MNTIPNVSLANQLRVLADLVEQNGEQALLGRVWVRNHRRGSFVQSECSIELSVDPIHVQFPIADLTITTEEADEPHHPG